VLAPIYYRLLLLDDRDHDAALRLLQRIEVADADIAALTVHTYLKLQRAADARRHLDQALQQYCLGPAGLLAWEASQALKNADMQAVGWVGLRPTLHFVGALAPGVLAGSLEIRFGEAAFAHPVKTVIRDGQTLFSFRSPQASAEAVLHVSAGGKPLLGSGRSLPLDFSLDGRAAGDTRQILGWARLGWLPAQSVLLKFEDEDGHSHQSSTKDIARPGCRWPFRIDPRRAGLRGTRITISAQLPDGRWQPLPDTPLLLSQALRIKDEPPVRVPRWREDAALKIVRRQAPRPAPLIDVIIPVYRGREETLACINSVLATLGDRGRAIVVDDSTPDATLAAALDDLELTGRITLLRNEQNLGFVRSVNRALALDSGNDVVLLNSDTLVFEDWLQRLSAAAYSASDVGTVTPLSNDGSIASYPNIGGSSIDAAGGAALHKLAAWTHPGISIEVPVGVGFCLYMRYDCLKEIGELDASVFGLGYGEEADFCMRARMRGWSHRIAADVFVYHAGSRSFGARRKALLDRSQRLVNLRYPGYDRFIREFMAQDPLSPVRRRLDERRLSSFEGRFVLLVTLALEGGVERYVAERCRQIRAQGSFPLVLKPLKAKDRRHCELWTDALDAPNLRYDIPANLPELVAILRRLRIDEMEISHFLHLDARVIDALRMLGVPYDVVLHDYAWICPRVTLIDGSGRYCKEPPVSVCQSCVQKNGSELGEKISVPALRARSGAWLAQARRVVAPSADTALRLRRYFPNIDIQPRPHAPPLTPVSRIAAAPRAENIRVGLIGAIGKHKGYNVLLACARDALKRRLPLEFVVVGFTQNDAPLLKTGKVFVTGRYAEIEVPHLLKRERPDIVFMPSVWPETWCYTVDYAVNAGLPVVSFDLGAIPERLRAAGLGLMLPLELSAAQINDRILARGSEDRIFDSTEDKRVREPRPAAIPAYVQQSRTPARDDARMRKTGVSNIMKSPAGEPTQEDGLSASVQVLPLPAGLYLFSVKAAAPPTERAEGKLQLPAMHVGLGPGVGADQVEFVAGPGTSGAWLFANGEVLSIEVERLETRSETPAEAPAEADYVPVKAPATGVHEPGSRAPAATAGEDFTVPLQIKTHIRSRGDMSFSDAPWAGRVGPGLWIESFSVRPLEHLTPKDIEYKGLTGTGFETPWQSGEQFCGTKGISMPLVGFAVRLKPGPEAAAFDCEYSGYYRSGATAGPFRNGAPCRSALANDPLEGIQIHITRRAKAAGAQRKVEAPRAAIKTPTFGRYRDGVGEGEAQPSASRRTKKRIV
jgi:GT2 family glycosyltransferase